jgi:predicted DNA-binding transcriptional regulator AlpA
MERLLTIKEIQEIFRTSRAGIYQRLFRTRAGQDDFPLPLWEKGRRCLWSENMILSYLAGKERELPPQPQGKEKRPVSEMTLGTLRKHGLLK